MAVDWSLLERDPLEYIMKKMVILSDHIRFSSVCSSWRTIAVNSRCRLPNQFPGLMVTSEDTSKRIFLQCIPPVSGSSGLQYFSEHVIELPVSHKFSCRASSYGWLVLTNGGYKMFLYHPFIRVKFDLPSMGTLPYPITPHEAKLSKWYVKKAVLSANPTTTVDKSTIIVLVIYGLLEPSLAFCKLGDIVWSPIRVQYGSYYLDAIYYKDHFYAINAWGGLCVCKIGDDDGRPRVNQLFRFGTPFLIHLPTMSTGIWLNRVLEPNAKKWVKVNSLDESTFFVGINSSFSIRSADFLGYSKNCIYFTDDYSIVEDLVKRPFVFGTDNGIYNVADGSVEIIYPTDLWSTSLPIPMWVSRVPW
ncbi:hypothetical protein GIB67_017088 [Kingdonia uniflora]|uniref:KIB1-4 beta-propeller domain-containing protein n=1 Tax=Kingdonia uniflora TaxID=39325 RepID=A0A7J7NCJ8_9MAGN|nr:hypothetical protein GIB67_017088 [Kingdonia uniflora]